MKKLLIFLIIACYGQIQGQDLSTSIQFSVNFHKKFYLSEKTSENPHCLTSTGKFKVTNKRDLFSRTMDDWGISLFQVREAENLLNILSNLEKWGLREKSQCVNMKKVLDQIIVNLEKEDGKISLKPLPGEFGIFCIAAAAGKRSELIGSLKRLSDLDAWFILECEWITKHIAVIREHENEFRSTWSPLGINGSLFGTSLAQRIYDISEIQLLIERAMFLSEKDKFIYQSYPGLPSEVIASARPMYRELYKHLSVETKSTLEKLTKQNYNLSYLNAQLSWYSQTQKGTLYCAKNLGNAISKLEKRVGKPTSDQIAEILSYRQGDVYCGYRADSRFLEKHSSIYSENPKINIRKRTKSIIGRIHSYSREHFENGASKNIQDTFSRKTASNYRLSNLTGVELANEGFTGIYPVRSKNNSFVTVQQKDVFITFDPSRGPDFEEYFPEWFVEENKTGVELYQRSIGGWIAHQVLVSHDKLIVTFDIPYIDE